MNKNSLKLDLVEGPVTYDFTLHLWACDIILKAIETAFGYFFGFSHWLWLLVHV